MTGTAVVAAVVTAVAVATGAAAGVVGAGSLDCKNDPNNSEALSVAWTCVLFHKQPKIVNPTDKFDKRVW